MPTITSLRPNVSREQALAMFGRGSLRGFVRALRLGPLRSLAEFYIPYWIYRAQISNAGRVEERTIAIDAINGSLDLFELPVEPPTISVFSRNVVPAGLQPHEGERLAVHKLQRVLFQGGFFKMRNLNIRVAKSSEVYVPYWVGFFGRGDRASIQIMDAVRRSVEGAKVRRIVEDWLAATPAGPR